MSTSLAGKHAVITGGGRGIGAAIAAQLAAAGAQITIMGRTVALLERHAEALRNNGATVNTIPCDIADEASVRDAFRIASERSPIHLLINNAGRTTVAPLHHTSMTEWESILRVNLTGAFLCCKQVLPGMIERKFGRIVNVASTAGLKGYTRLAAYCASKHGLIGLTRSLALETAKVGITVNAVCPSYTETDMTAEGMKNISARLQVTGEEARGLLVKGIPQGEMIQPAQVAAAVLWLCSPAAASITGVALPIAGGEVM